MTSENRKTVEKQIESFNLQDLDTFMACYHENIKVFMLQSNQVLADGIDNLRKVMTPSFKGTASKTEILETIENGNLIVNREKITGHTQGQTIYAVSIYELTDGLISQLWFGGRVMVDEE